MTDQRRRWAVVAVATAALSGCGGTPEPAAAEWREPASYRYDLDSRCGERALIGKFRITVEQGAVSAAESLDEGGEWAVETLGTERMPTLGDLLGQVDTARSQGAHIAEVTTDPAGRPAGIRIDSEENAVDDEACYTITGFSTS
ncbi:DUF6174 domain-containing protein [Actinoplanes sp. NPDC023714]|uniref:DUF6174 domain-containing protein n=1 Tax=Actinoplanes sp. NPDC023714 TaxID=3154322 RepID=UPI0033CE6565